MSRVEVRAFEAADIPAAGALLAERHRRHRLAQPLLSPGFESAEASTAQVRAAFEQEGASGAVALHGASVVGYLLGGPKPGAIWGPNVWVESAGQAATEAETARDLYAVAATRWVDEGRTAQYVIVPATDPELVRAWFRLGFGQQQAHAIRPLADFRSRLRGSQARSSGSPEPTAPFATPVRVTVRRAERADIPVLARLDLELPRHQGLAPTFSSGSMDTLEDAEESWAEDIDNPDFANFVAERDGVVVGSAVGCALTKSSSHSGLTRPENAGFLGFAAVFPAARGLGAGRALGEAVLGWTAEAGFACAVTDWRVTNLTSSRAWPALGFTETFLRLHRHVGY